MEPLFNSTATKPLFVSLPSAAGYIGIDYSTALRIANTGALARDADGHPIIRVMQVGGQWKVPLPDLAQLGNYDAAQLTALLPRRKRPMSARDTELVAAYRNGATVTELATLYGITSQRVSQIIHKTDPTAIPEMTRVRIERRKQKRQEQHRDQLRERTKQCRVCGEWFLSGKTRRRECSEECQRAYKLGRRYFDPEQYERHRQHQGIDTTKPPRARWFSPESAVVQALQAVGRTDLLPTPAPRPRPETSPCSATNLNGTPCSRKVPTGTELCHIHRAMAQGSPIDSCCGQVETSCICGLPPGHDGAHHCLRPTMFGVVCDGQWESNPFRIIRLPGFFDA